MLRVVTVYSKWTILTVILPLMCCATAQAKDLIDLTRWPWGSPQSAIESNVTDNRLVHKTDNVMVYDIEVGNGPGKMAFNFDRGLYSIGIIPDGIDQGDIAAWYNALSASVAEDYGPPQEKDAACKGLPGPCVRNLWQIKPDTHALVMRAGEQGKERVWLTYTASDMRNPAIRQEAYAAALATVQKHKLVRSAAWNSKSFVPSLLVGVTGQGKKPGAYNGLAQGFCGTLAAKGIGGAVVHVLDEDQPTGTWGELGKAECPELPSADAASAKTERFMNISAVAGKDTGAVSKVLGTPTGTEKSKYGQRAYYKLKDGTEVEIVYISGKADWITIHPGSPVPFGPACGQAIGITVPPTFASSSVVRWDGWKTAEAHAAGPHVDYWYIKVKTQ